MAHRLFGGPLPTAEIVVLAAFAVASVAPSLLVAQLALAIFVILFVFAVAERRVVDIALLAGTYFVFRFNLIETAREFRYVSDLISAASIAAVVALLVTRRGRLRWYDGLFIVLGLYGLGLAFVRDVPLTPALVQVRALLGVYPLFMLVRELGFSGVGVRRVAALAFYEFFAWALFVQAFIEKATEKLLFTTAFVRETPISFTNWPRVYGWTANPNSLGALCVLLIALGILLAAWGFRGRWLTRGLSLYFGTLVLSVSRSAMWGLIAFLAIVLFQRTFEGAKRRDIWRVVRRPFAVGLAAALLAVSLSVVIPVVTQAVGWTGEGFSIFGRFVTGDDEVQSSIKGGRLFSLRTGLAIATRGIGDLAFGQGPATYGSAGSKFWTPPLYEQYDIPEGFYADMFGVMMLVEVGVVGLVLLVGGLVGLAWSNSAMPRSWRIGIGALLTIWSLFYNVPEITMLYFPILVFLGVRVDRPSGANAAAWSHEVWTRSVAQHAVSA